MKYIHFFISIVLFFLSIIGYSIFCIFPAAVCRLFGAQKQSRKIYHVCAPAIARYILFILNYKVHVNGWENLPKDKSNVAFVSNHQSMLDVCVYYGILGLTPVPIAKIEVLKAPFLSSFVKGLGSILIDRKSPKSSIKAIHDATDRLKEGGQCIIFPEGTRSKDGNIGELKAGSYKMALRAGSRIVPLVINGTRNGLEDKKGMSRYHVYVNVLPEVETKDLSKEEKKLFPEIISKQIIEAYAKLPEIKKY